MSKDTKFLLGIKDPNIKKVSIINDIQKKGPLEAQAVLNYRPKACPKCGVVNRKTIIRYGWRQVQVKLLRSSERDIILHLKKRNFKYKVCQSYFLAATTLTQRHHTISNNVRFACLEKLSEPVTMTQFAKSNVKYKALKRYWKLLLKPSEKLDIKNYKHYSFITGLHTQNQVVEEMLDFNPELRRAYDALHTLRSAIKYRDVPRLRQVLDPSNQFSEEIEKHFVRLRDSQVSIENALKYQYSNGPLEGTNNKIKVLKHTAYGFGNFNNFRLRIHLMFELKKGA